MLPEDNLPVEKAVIDELNKDRMQFEHKNFKGVRAYAYEMVGFTDQCVDKYLELSGVNRKTLRKVATPNIDDHSFTPEDFETRGEL